MPFFDPIRIGASGAVADTTYTVDRGLKFIKSDSMYLERTPSSTGNQKFGHGAHGLKELNYMMLEEQLTFSVVIMFQVMMVLLQFI